MSLLTDLLKSIDPSATPNAPAPASSATAAPKQAPRPAAASNGTPQAAALKRKAEGQTEGGQAKVLRKDGIPPGNRLSGTASTTLGPRSNGEAPPNDAAKSRPTTPSASIPYRGTARALGAGLKASDTSKKPNQVTTPSSGALKTGVTVKKPASSTGNAPTSASATGPGKSSYLLMMEKAKAAQEKAKAAPPVVKVDAPKILTKKEREESRKRAAGKKVLPAPSAIAAKSEPSKAEKEKRKLESGYQGTARPAKKPESTYKGTARPRPTGAPGRSPGLSSSNTAKPKKAQARYGGYASWSDLDEEEDEGEDEEGYESSDMEGNLWEVEEEEQKALRAAKQEDAIALAEEKALAEQKAERKRRLAAMSKAAAAKKKY
ncbi:hypothetical protein M011DRAFT_464792 [Sporormia fimetaria CBS 119925]|uniref:SPT2-domain-containing protein n=1 Tax=Sporormia fimetaria CBS 119925 TaxID=1340428 RepID=A0A6A6VK54_9PLEO|nr:hypothetical protein M011DRAFT_464792 [Sporormia fimetaria CBS 119925]